LEGKKNLVRPERFELPTYCSGGNRSIHLSYGRTVNSSSLHAQFGSINVDPSRPSRHRVLRQSATLPPGRFRRGAGVAAQTNAKCNCRVIGRGQPSTRPTSDLARLRLRPGHHGHRRDRRLVLHGRAHRLRRARFSGGLRLH
jgi:hypothetical protein